MFDENDLQTEWGDSKALDSAFELLAARERRAVVAYFRERDAETATVDDIVEQCRQAEGTGDDPTAADHVKLDLLHCHLPQLAEAGVVEYDARSETVRYRGDALVEAVFERVRDVEPRSVPDSSAE